MGNKFFDLLTTFAVAAIITSLVLPKRQTPQVIGAAGTAFVGIEHAAEGL